MQTIARLARRLASAPLRLLGLELRRLPSEQTDQFERVYSKYRDRTMLGREEYIANLRLSSTVRAQGCVIECGVWKGGTIAGMAEVLGADREYFLFDSFQGHLDPQPIDGPAALAWKEDKDGPWYFDNAVVGTEDAEGAMLSSGAKSFKLVKGWFEDTLPHFVPPVTNCCTSY